MTCVTGVSGSGKSSLVIDTLYRALAQRLVRLEGEARARTTRSPAGSCSTRSSTSTRRRSAARRAPIPATYTGLFTHIRDLFAQLPEARVRGYGPGRFSFNVKGGRCEACAGDGVIKIEMHFLPDVYVTCEVCHGRRYNRETLEVHYKGKSIADVLDMTVGAGARVPRQRAADPAEARDAARRRPRLHPPRPVGDDALRRRGAAHQARQGAEPARHRPDALHPRRADHRPALRRHQAAAWPSSSRLADAGNTVVVIEHNLDVIKTADHVIDLGPEGGDGGGRIVAVGTPEEIARTRGSITGRVSATPFSRELAARRQRPVAG